MKLRLRRHNIWWWSRLAVIFAAVFAADQVYFHFVGAPRTWAEWPAYDALAFVIGIAGGLPAGVLFEICCRVGLHRRSS